MSKFLKDRVLRVLIEDNGIITILNSKKHISLIRYKNGFPELQIVSLEQIFQLLDDSSKKS